MQFKPLLPGKKKPAGENWKRHPEPSSLAPVKTDDAVGSQRRVLALKPMGDPRYDDVNGQEHAHAIKAIANDGATVDRDAMADYATETHNEHLYEEITDKQTGKKSLLFRSNIFDRY